MLPEPASVDRFRNDLDALIAPGARIGIAVSGGPDSLALLLLAAAARPGEIEAATVDHALRNGSREEAEMVARICRQLGVPHAILTAQWAAKPESALQERAREERYRLLGRWAADRGLDAIATAHHADDQAETLLMRLTRGAGVRGLSGMRPCFKIPGSEVVLIRPLLGWRRVELADVVRSAGLEAADDPSNHDARFERVRVRQALRTAQWLDPEALALSASNLREAEAALEWAAAREWDRAVDQAPDGLVYRPDGSPPEIRRRILCKAVSALATEGEGAELRGRELDRLVTALDGGSKATIRGVCCTGGARWQFSKAPPRRR